MGGPKVYSVRAVMATSGLSFTESCAVVLQKAANSLQFTLVRARKDNWQGTIHCEQGEAHLLKSLFCHPQCVNLDIPYGKFACNVCITYQVGKHFCTLFVQPFLGIFL